MLDYYIKHSIYSDPGFYQSLYDDLPSDMPSLIAAVNQLFFHYADQRMYDYQIPNGRYRELDVRLIQKTLKLLLNKSEEKLNIQRDPENKIIGVCRDCALMLCSIVRSRGIPARLRAGFNAYYLPGFYLDGFCLEYFDQSLSKWRMVDPRTTQFYIQYHHLKINFDLTNLSDQQFIPAAKAWIMCRSGQMDPFRFGYQHFRGLNYVRNKVIQDFILLNKHELLIWDLWGILLDKNDTHHCAVDALANFLLSNIDDLCKIADFYRDHHWLHLPKKILVANPFLPERWEKLRCFH